jgi:hypothetical protein
LSDPEEKINLRNSSTMASPREIPKKYRVLGGVR